MATTFLAATPIQDTFLLPGTNTPGNGVQLFCYAAGSSTKTTVYKDNAGATPHTNPIVLDSGGNIPSGGEVWQTQGQSMKYVYAPSNDTDPPASPYRTLDNMPGVNDVTAQTGVEWLTGPTPTFVSGTQFTLVGDQTATFTKGRRVKTTNTGGTVYSTIVNSTFGALTTVNIVNDAGALDAGLSAVSYGLFDPANPSISPVEAQRKGANVSSATSGTTDIWGIVGDYAHITGTTFINFFSTAPYAGAERTVITDAAVPINHNTALISIPGNANITTAANDRFTVRAETVSTATITSYNRATTGFGTTKQATRTVFTTSSGTYSTPNGATRINVRMWGGGGGGAGSGAGGGTGTSGSSTTFGTLTASGGANRAGAVGTGTNGDINISGVRGGNTANNVSTTIGGMGGAAWGGSATPGGEGNAGAGVAAPANSGSGGGGAGNSTTPAAAEAGGSGGGYVEKLFAPPSATYAYVVGPGGTGGGAGTLGATGGNGGSGLIVVDEYYG